MNEDTLPYPLGRLHAPDERDARYPMAAALAPTPAPHTSRYYRTGAVLNQGRTSQCVAYAWRQWLQSAPIMSKAGPDPQGVYDLAQQQDEWPGPPPAYDGTSVRAGAKVLQQQGFIASYHWTANAGEARDYLLMTSTAVVGINWYESFFAPDPQGYIRLRGEAVGGHAFLLIGYSVERAAFRAINSWGPEWAQKGRFWIAHDVMQRLLDENGECCGALEAKR